MRKDDTNDVETLKEMLKLKEMTGDLHKFLYNELFEDYIRALGYTQHQPPCLSEAISGKKCVCGLDKLLERSTKLKPLK